MTLAYIGLGSNIGDREQNLRKAVSMLGEAQGVEVARLSRIYETTPVGDVEQGDFLNAVVEIETNLAPPQLLKLTKSIEERGHRVRTVHWGPRTIDLDILLYDDVEMNEPHLNLPHPEVSKRAFVLVPLAELAPEKRLPNGKTIRALLDDLGEVDGVRRYA